MPDDLMIRHLEEADLPTVLALNAGAVPGVGEIDRARLDDLLAWATVAPAAVDAYERLVGFAIALGPGQPYESPNYRWFADTYDSFLYVDRVVVAPNVRGAGIGSALYAHLEHAAEGAEVLCAEVNVRPRNDTSLAFHAARGFEEVGQQEVYEGAYLVSLMAKPLRATRPTE